MPYNDAMKRAQSKYKSQKREKITLEFPQGTKEILKQLSMLEDESVTRYIVRACYMRARNAGADSSIIDGLPWCDDLRDRDKET